jgi:hypothetical protein
MTKTKRMLSGLIVAVMVALTLLATGGDAYAKMKSSGGNGITRSDGTTPAAPGSDTFQTLGVTWE